jgi:hypothetical protein
MRYKFVSEADNHFVIHDGESHFPIAKSGLDKSSMDKIRSLPKVQSFEEGGRVDDQIAEDPGLTDESGNYHFNYDQSFPEGGPLPQSMFNVPPEYYTTKPELAGKEVPNFDPNDKRTWKYYNVDPNIDYSKASAPDPFLKKEYSQGYIDNSPLEDDEEEEQPKEAVKKIAKGKVRMPPMQVTGNLPQQGQSPYAPFLSREQLPVWAQDQTASTSPAMQLGATDKSIAAAQAGAYGTKIPDEMFTPGFQFGPTAGYTNKAGKTPQTGPAATSGAQPFQANVPAYLSRTQEMAKGQGAQDQQQPTNANAANLAGQVQQQQTETQQNPTQPSGQGGFPSFDYTNMMEYPQQMMGAYNQINQGYQDLAGIQGEQAKQNAIAYNKAYGGLDALNQQMQFHFNNLDQENAQLKDQVINGKLDPFRVFHQSTANNVMAGIAVLLGGLSQGLTGARTNPAVDMITNIVDRDIDAQKNELGKNMNLLALNMAKYKNVAEATMATRANLLSLLDAQLAKSAAEAGTPQAQAQYQIQSGMLRNQMLQQLQPLAQMMMMRSVMSNPNGIPPNVVNWLPKEVKDTLVRMPNGNFTMATTGKGAEEVNKAIAQFDLVDKNIKEAREALQQGRVNPFSEEGGRRKTLDSQLIINAKQALDLGGFRESEKQFVEAASPQTSAWFTSLAGEKGKLDQLEKYMKEKRATFLRQHVPSQTYNIPGGSNVPVK